VSRKLWARVAIAAATALLRAANRPHGKRVRRLLTYRDLVDLPTSTVAELLRSGQLAHLGLDVRRRR
jgi:hypothetical protein